jgi:hypothetical protein
MVLQRACGGVAGRTSRGVRVAKPGPKPIYTEEERILRHREQNRRWYLNRGWEPCPACGGMKKKKSRLCRGCAHNGPKSANGDWTTL